MLPGSGGPGIGTLLGETDRSACLWPALDVFPNGDMVTARLDMPDGTPPTIRVGLFAGKTGDVLRDGDIRLRDAPSGDLYRDLAVTALPCGSSIVSWTCHGFQAYADWSVLLMAQELDAAGDAQGGVVLVTTNDTGTPKHHSLTALSGAGCVVVWSDERCEGGSDIRAALIPPDTKWLRSAARALPSPYLRCADPGRSAHRPMVSATPCGGFLVLWREGGLAPSDEDALKGRLFDAVAQPRGPTFPVEATRGGGGPIMAPALAVLPEARFVVSWIESRPRPGSAQPEIDLLARVFTLSGLPLGEAFPVRSSFDPLIDGPCVAALAGGGFAIAWEVHGQDARQEAACGVRAQIRAQVFSHAGYPVGTEIACAGSGMAPRLHALADGGVLLSWSAADGIRTRTVAVGSSDGPDHGLRPFAASQVR